MTKDELIEEISGLLSDLNKAELEELKEHIEEKYDFEEEKDEDDNEEE